MTYLTTQQYKLDKSVAHGYKTVGLNLSPAHEAADVLRAEHALVMMPTMCAMAGVCADGCLAKTGMNVFPASIRARAQKTREWVESPKQFLAAVLKELDTAATSAAKKGQGFAMRPNLLSDQRKLAVGLAKARPTIQFYDYTKLPPPKMALPANYHLTYSVSERTTPQVLDAWLARGVNPAIVVDTKRGQPLPKTFMVRGRALPVIDGDEHDLRFLDKPGHVVLLRWKGSQAKLGGALLRGFAFSAEHGLPPSLRL